MQLANREALACGDIAHRLGCDIGIGLGVAFINTCGHAAYERRLHLELALDLSTDLVSLEHLSVATFLELHLLYCLGIGSDRGKVTTSRIQIGESLDAAIKQLDFPFKVLLAVVMVHQLKDISELYKQCQLLSIEAEIGAHLAHTHRTQGERLLICLLQLRRAIHQALIRLAVADR